MASEEPQAPTLSSAARVAVRAALHEVATVLGAHPDELSVAVLVQRNGPGGPGSAVALELGPDLPEEAVPGWLRSTALHLEARDIGDLLEAVAARGREALFEGLETIGTQVAAGLARQGAAALEIALATPGGGCMVVLAPYQDPRAGTSGRVWLGVAGMPPAVVEDAAARVAAHARGRATSTGSGLILPGHPEFPR